jgi:uncharacterized membrane protein
MGVTSRNTMKQSETVFRNVSLILSFIYAGISFLLFVLFLITLVRGGQTSTLTRFVGKVAIQNLKPLLTLMLIVTGLGTLVSLLAGIVILKNSNQQVVAEVEVKKEEEKKNEVQEELLTEDEKKVVKCLEEHESVMSQKDLAKESKLSKVKVHRILKRLEAKKVISKYEFGMTNRIKLEKKLKD